MIHFAWPWLVLALPLPWLAKRLLPPVRPTGEALFLPFAGQLAGDGEPVRAKRPRGRSVLLALVWLLLVGAAVRPQWLGDPLPIPSTGRRLLLAVDVSGSMATEDMAGNATRLAVVQAVAGDFISRRYGDQVGLILFGTRPYLQAPLTADLPTVDQFLQQAEIGVAGRQTAIGDAIGLAIKRLQAAPVQLIDPAHEAGKTVLILLTDGASDAGMADPLAAARMAADNGLRIYTIGVGAPVEQGFFGTSGNAALDEKTLRAIAEITQGEYFRATDADSLNQIYARIDQIEPSAGREQWYRPPHEWYPWPLALALLLSVPAVFLRERAA